MMIPVQSIWLIPALPLLAAAIGALTPRRGKVIASTAAIGAMVLAFGLSVAALVGALQGRTTFNFTWFELGETVLKLGLINDPLTAFMLVMVTFVGSLIFIFSVGYMHEDENFTRFFCFLSLFAAAMLGLLVANSLLLLFVCWELVGLASYLLIGFWFHKPSAAAAAKKAFITTRIGDLGLLLGLLWLYDKTGTLLFFDGGAGCLDETNLKLLTHVTVGGLALSTVIGLLIFCGAIGKSGQFPLHVWLPDAMEGPTPVSALIHAATMVAAGVFLMARVYPLVSADLLRTDVALHALTVVAFIGAITALLGSVIAIAQNDIKRILAFSTVSQLGYMMLAIGVGSWVAAIFHLLTHAFFKALLFLGAGSVIHAAHHEQDIRKLGGLSRSMKTTFATFSIGMMALSGVPFLFSGFWSKEGILHAAHGWPVSHVPFLVAVGGAGLTAFYMTRLMCEVFFGQAPRDEHLAHHPPHENPKVMTVPLVLLAICAIVLGFLGTPVWPWLQVQLGGGELHVNFGHLFEADSLKLTFLSIVVVGVGLGLGWFIYGRKLRKTEDAPDPIEAAAPSVFAALANRLGFDELYAATVFRLNRFTALLADGLDRWVWGGVVRALGALSKFVAVTNRSFDEDTINEGFDEATRGLRGSAKAYSRAQPGEAHGYLRAVAIGFVVLALLVVLGGVR